MPEKILEVHVKDIPLVDDLDLDSLAGMTVAFPGAELKNPFNEATR
jgi:cell division protease FtsH